MNSMQQFYETYIIAAPSNPYHLLAEAAREDFPLDEIPGWINW